MLTLQAVQRTQLYAYISYCRIMIHVIKLTPSDSDLIGKIARDRTNLIKVDVSDVAMSVTAPDATDVRDAEIMFQNDGGKTLTINGYGSQTLAKESSQELSDSGDLLRLISDGENWA